MSDAAFDLDGDRESPGQRPTLRPVADAPVAEASTDPLERTVARSAAVGATLGFVITTLVVSVVGTIVGFGLGPSLGLAVFIGMWSGVGAGFMFGATVPFARHLDAAHADRPSTTRST